MLSSHWLIWKPYEPFYLFSLSVTCIILSFLPSLFPLTSLSNFCGQLKAAHSKLQVLYSPRDYRSEGASGSEWKEVTVRSSTEALFQPQNSTKVRKYKLSSIISMSLSAWKLSVSLPSFIIQDVTIICCPYACLDIQSHDVFDFCIISVYIPWELIQIK